MLNPCFCDRAALDFSRTRCYPFSKVPHEPDARVVRHRAYSLAFEEWFAALPRAEQARLRTIGLDKPEREQFGPVRGAEEENERPEAGEWNHPTQQDAFDTSTDAEREFADAFGAALAWCARGSDLVDMGRRLLAVLHVWRPALIAGIAVEIERAMLAEFRREVDGDDPPGGAGLGAPLEWLRRGTSLSQLGQRVLAMAYVLRPVAIAGATLAAIGAFSNKTRQAVDKLVQECRDTFGGVRSRAMRSEDHRKICRKAQLLRA